MVQRLLLDRIDTESARTAPGCQYDSTLVVLADETEAALTLFQSAGTRAEVALHMGIVDLVPVLCRMVRFGNPGRMHGASLRVFLISKMHLNRTDINKKPLSGCIFSLLIQTWIK
jgi:hypothetical protein